MDLRSLLLIEMWVLWLGTFRMDMKVLILLNKPCHIYGMFGKEMWFRKLELPDLTP